MMRQVPKRPQEAGGRNQTGGAVYAPSAQRVPVIKKDVPGMPTPNGVGSSGRALRARAGLSPLSRPRVKMPTHRCAAVGRALDPVKRGRR